MLETDLLPARVDVYDPADLDAVAAAGEIVWVGVEPLGDRDGRLALYLADHLPHLLTPHAAHSAPQLSARETAVLQYLREHGAAFFALFMPRSAAATRQKRSTRCGVSCGTDSPPTTPSIRCVR
jgi:hypothetical protein